MNKLLIHSPQKLPIYGKVPRTRIMFWNLCQKSFWYFVSTKDWWEFYGILNFSRILLTKYFLALSQVRICRPSPPQKWSDFHERCAMCWNEWYINNVIFIFKLWLIFFTTFKCFYRPCMVKNIVSKYAQCFETDFCVLEFFFATFSFWDIVDFVFDIHSE